MKIKHPVIIAQVKILKNVYALQELLNDMEDCVDNYKHTKLIETEK